MSYLHAEAPGAAPLAVCPGADLAEVATFPVVRPAVVGSALEFRLRDTRAVKLFEFPMPGFRRDSQCLLRLGVVPLLPEPNAAPFTLVATLSDGIRAVGVALCGDGGLEGIDYRDCGDSVSCLGARRIGGTGAAWPEQQLTAEFRFRVADRLTRAHVRVGHGGADYLSARALNGDRLRVLVLGCGQFRLTSLGVGWEQDAPGTTSWPGEPCSLMDFGSCGVAGSR